MAFVSINYGIKLVQQAWPQASGIRKHSSQAEYDWGLELISRTPAKGLHWERAGWGRLRSAEWAVCRGSSGLRVLWMFAFLFFQKLTSPPLTSFPPNQPVPKELISLFSIITHFPPQRQSILDTVTSSPCPFKSRPWNRFPDTLGLPLSGEFCSVVGSLVPSSLFHRVYSDPSCWPHILTVEVIAAALWHLVTCFLVCLQVFWNV